MFSLFEAGKFHLFVFIIISFNPNNIFAQINGQALTSNKQVFSETKKNTRPEATKIENYIKAIEAYRKDLVESPTALGFNNLGAAYAKIGKDDEAINAFRKALEIDPNSPKIHYNLSVIYERQNRFAEALNSLQKAVSLNGKDAVFRTAMCEVLLSLEKYEESLPCFETLFNLKTPDVFDKTNYGLALLYAKKQDKSLFLLQTTMSQFPNEAVVHNALGIFLFLTKKYKESVPYFLRAVELDNDLAPARFNLALAQLATNDRDSALKNYAFLKNSNSEYAAKLYEQIFRGRIIQVREK